jgi:hypothetical protein
VGYLADLRLSLLLNSALVAIKSKPVAADNGRLAIKHTTRALALDGDSIREQGHKTLSNNDKAKILYRRAIGHLSVRDEAEKAIADLREARLMAPDDTQIAQA